MTEAERLRDIALELRTIAASRLDATEARTTRAAADELAGIADALENGGGIVGNVYAAVPVPEDVANLRIPIPPPPLSGKHRHPARCPTHSSAALETAR
jgi:hypothetical protein